MSQYERDDQGLIVRLGLDPQMKMEEGATAPSEPGQAPVSGEPSPESPAPESVVDQQPANEPQGSDKWDEDTRKYIEGLRAENAKHRTRASRFEQTFEGWPEEAVDGMLGLAKAIESGDESAVPVLQDLLSKLTPEQQAAVEGAIEQQTVEQETKFMTPEQVEEYIAQREAQKEEEAKASAAEKEALSALEAEITGMGYNLAEPNPEAALLFHFAGLQEGDGPKDFKKAHEAVEALFQSRIDEYVGRVAGRNSRFAKSASTTGLTPAGVDGGKKSLGITNGGSRKAMEEFLASSD